MSNFFLCNQELNKLLLVLHSYIRHYHYGHHLIYLLKGQNGRGQKIASPQNWVRNFFVGETRHTILLPDEAFSSHRQVLNNPYFGKNVVYYQVLY